MVFRVKRAQEVSGRLVKIQAASLPLQISDSVDQGWALELALLTSSQVDAAPAALRITL